MRRRRGFGRGGVVARAGCAGSGGAASSSGRCAACCSRREKRFPRRETACEGVFPCGCRFSRGLRPGGRHRLVAVLRVALARETLSASRNGVWARFSARMPFVAGVAAGWASSSRRGPACCSRARNAFRIEKRHTGAFFRADAVSRGAIQPRGSRPGLAGARETLTRHTVGGPAVTACAAIRRDDRSARDVPPSRRAEDRCAHRLISTSLATVFALRAVPVTPSRFSSHPACSFEPPMPSG